MIMSNEESNNRELDAWIAEHVFGWKRWNFDNGFPETRKNYLSKDNEKQDKYRKRGFILGLPLIDNFPRYTTDPSAAMMVLERCLERLSPSVEIISGDIDSKRHFWIGRPDEYTKLSMFEPTLPLAICALAKNLFTK